MRLKFERVRHREVIYLRALISEVSNVKAANGRVMRPQMAVYSFARTAGEPWEPMPKVEIRGLRQLVDGTLGGVLSATFHRSDDGHWENPGNWEPPYWLDEIFELEYPPFSDVPMLRAWLEQHGAVRL